MTAKRLEGLLEMLRTGGAQRPVDGAQARPAGGGVALTPDEARAVGERATLGAFLYKRVAAWAMLSCNVSLGVGMVPTKERQCPSGEPCAPCFSRMLLDEIDALIGPGKVPK